MTGIPVIVSQLHPAFSVLVTEPNEKEEDDSRRKSCDNPKSSLSSYQQPSIPVPTTELELTDIESEEVEDDIKPVVCDMEIEITDDDFDFENDSMDDKTDDNSSPETGSYLEENSPHEQSPKKENETTKTRKSALRAVELLHSMSKSGRTEKEESDSDASFDEEDSESASSDESSNYSEGGCQSPEISDESNTKVERNSAIIRTKKSTSKR